MANLRKLVGSLAAMKPSTKAASTWSRSGSPWSCGMKCVAGSRCGVCHCSHAARLAGLVVAEAGTRCMRRAAGAGCHGRVVVVVAGGHGRDDARDAWAASIGIGLSMMRLVCCRACRRDEGGEDVDGRGRRAGR